MNYIHTETKEYPLTSGDIISRHSASVSFPFPFEPLPEYSEVVEKEKPEYDEALQYVKEIEPTEVDGVYTQNWEVVNFTQKELTQIEVEKAEKERLEKLSKRISVTKRQALLALFEIKGIKDTDISALIESIKDDSKRYTTRIDWEGSAMIESDSPTVLLLAEGLGLNEQSLDALFNYARTL